MIGPIRILHLEDSESDSIIVQQVLKKENFNYIYQCAENRKQFEELLASFSPDVILSDHSIPSFDSTEAFKLVKEKSINAPFILLTGAVSDEFAVSRMKDGVSDYILKDRIQRLPSAIENSILRYKAEENRETYLRELISKEKRFRTLLENSQEAIVLLNSDLNIIYRSEAAWRINGWSKEERDKLGFLSHTHPDENEQVREAIKQMFEQPGVPIDLDFRTQHRQGHYIWVAITMTNWLHDADLNAIVINFRDITKKKNAEKELERTSKHFKALLENISDAIILINELGKILYRSPSAEKISGFSFKEMAEMTIFDLFHPDDLKSVNEILEKLFMRPDVPVQKAFRIRNKDEKYIWVEGTVTNLLHDESVKALVINYRDITSRKNAEALLQKSEANLRTIFNNTNISYVLLDNSLNIVSFNHRAAERYQSNLGAKVTEGKNMLDYVPSHIKSHAAEQFGKVLRGEKTFYEAALPVSGENEEWYSVNTFPVYSESKKVIGIIVATEDITQRKSIEVEREKMTAALLQHNKDLEQFAYIVSHNLRSPVANILGLSNLINSFSDLSAPDFEKCLKGITQSVEKLDTVISDLNFILQTRREINAVKETVNFSSLLDDIKTSISEMIEKNQVTIKSDFKCAQIFTVKSYLYSVLYNLLTNSIKYRNSEVRTLIEVSTESSYHTVTLKIKDNGLGINLQRHGEKLFGLYRKFHPHIEGKGMGLYMVKTQVGILGGSISIDSAENKGSEFTITLPFT